jgi:hypothetical protein
MLAIASSMHEHENDCLFLDVDIDCDRSCHSRLSGCALLPAFTRSFTESSYVVCSTILGLDHIWLQKIVTDPLVRMNYSLVRLIT